MTYKDKLKRAGILNYESMTEKEAMDTWKRYVDRADTYLTKAEKRRYAISRKQRANVVRDGCGEII